MTNAAGRLLLVEDEREAREALARALERRGFDVRAAADTSSALLCLDSPDSIDVAVIDVVLGADDRGGLRVLEKLRSSTSRTRLAPVVMVTAFADVDKVKSALNLGASHLLEKPFRAAELVLVIDRLLAKSTEEVDRTESIRAAFDRAGLTPREGEVALLALKGLSSPEIAQVLAMSEKTVRQHLSRVYEKHGVSGRGELFHLLLPI